MVFQFLCPEGHLLQGEESQVGQQCKCPYCGLEFLVPSPDGTPVNSAAAAAFSAAPAPPPPAAPPAEEAPFAGIRVGPGSRDVPEDVAQQIGAPSTEQDILHILCPSGHVLETPREMLGQDAMCPFCQTQFRLRLEDSREFKQQQEDQRTRREQKLGKAWLNWAIAAAVVVVLGVILMIVIANAR